MTLQTVAILTLFVSKSLCGILDPRQLGTTTSVGNWTFTKTSTSSTISNAPYPPYDSSNSSSIQSPKTASTSLSLYSTDSLTSLSSTSYSSSSFLSSLSQTSTSLASSSPVSTLSSSQQFSSSTLSLSLASSTIIPTLSSTQKSYSSPASVSSPSSTLSSTLSSSSGSTYFSTSPSDSGSAPRSSSIATSSIAVSGTERSSSSISESSENASITPSKQFPGSPSSIYVSTSLLTPSAPLPVGPGTASPPSNVTFSESIHPAPPPTLVPSISVASSPSGLSYNTSSSRASSLDKLYNSSTAVTAPYSELSSVPANSTAKTLSVVSPFLATVSTPAITVDSSTDLNSFLITNTTLLISSVTASVDATSKPKGPLPYVSDQVTTSPIPANSAVPNGPAIISLNASYSSIIVSVLPVSAGHTGAIDLTNVSIYTTSQSTDSASYASVSESSLVSTTPTSLLIESATTIHTLQSLSSASANLTSCSPNSSLNSTITASLTPYLLTPSLNSTIGLTGSVSPQFTVPTTASNMGTGTFSRSVLNNGSYQASAGPSSTMDSTSNLTVTPAFSAVQSIKTVSVPSLGLVTGSSKGLTHSANTTIPLLSRPLYSSGQATGLVSGSGVNPIGGHPVGGYNVSATIRPSGGYPQNTAPPMGTAPYRGPFPPSANASSNISTCGGTTVNIPDATLNWWYTTDFDFAAATFSAQFNYNDSLTGWTLLSATTTFNVTSALAEPTYSVTTLFDTYINSSVEYFYEYTTPTAEYASTAVVTQAATVSLNASTGVGTLPSSVFVTPAPASTVLPGPSSSALTALTNTPFVYFSEFAIDVEKPTRVQNGSMACATSRQLYTLPSAFGMYYDESDPGGQSEVTGDLPDEFLQELASLHIPLARLKLGTYVAEPTLLVVVEEVYVAEAVLAVSTQLTETSLLVPSSSAEALSAASASLVTLTAHTESSESSLLVPISTTGNYVTPALFIAHTEVSETSLDVPTTTSAGSPVTQVRIPEVTGTVTSPVIIPFTAIVGGSQTTLLAPSNEGGVITTTVEGSIVVTAKAATTGTATALEDQQTSSIDDAAGLSGLISAVQSAQASVGNAKGGTASAATGASGSGSEVSGSTNSDSTASDGSGSGGSGSGSNGSGSSGSGTSGSDSTGSESSGSGSDSGSSSGSSNSGSSGSNASGSGSTGSGTGGSGSGSSDSSSSEQQSAGLASLVSAIEQAGQSTGSNVQATAGSGSGSSQSDGSGTGSSGSGGSQAEGSSPGGSSSGGSSSGGSSSGGSSSGGSSSGGSSGNVLAPVPVSIGGIETTIGPASNVVIGSQTLVLGGAAITVAGTPISLGPSAVLVGTKTQTFPTSSTLVPIAVSIGGAQATITPASNAILGSQTLIPGGPVITVSGTAVSLGPSAVVVGTQTYTFAASPVQGPGSASATGSQAGQSGSVAPSVITIGGSLITQAPVPVFIVGGQTLTPGQTITFDNSAVSIGSGGTLVIGGSSISGAVLGSPTILTAAGETIVVSSVPAFVLGGSATLLPGGQAVTVDGTQLSLAPSASALVIDGSVTSNIVSVATVTPLALTIGSSVLTANAATQFLLASGNILTPGGRASISGTTVSLDSGGSIAVINGATQTLSAPTITPAPSLTVGGTIYEPNLGSTYEIAGQELTPGGVITASGTTISLASDASVAVINGVTATLDAVVNGVAAPEPTAAAVLNVGGQSITANSGSTFVIGGSTLTPGGVLILGSGNSATTISLGASGVGNVVINGVTSTLSSAVSANTQPALTIAGQTYSADVSDAYVISGKTLTPGGSAITFTAQNGAIETVSLGQDSGTLVVNGVTTPVAVLGSLITPGPLVVDGQTYTAISGADDSPAYLISGQTLVAGGSAITFTAPGGAVETVSLGQDGSSVVINGITSTIATRESATTHGPLTIHGQTFAPVSGSGSNPTYIISGQTLTEGGVVTFSDGNGAETVSLSLGGNVAVINGVSSTVPTEATITLGPLTINGQVYTAISGAGGPTYVISGQTLTEGGAITFEDSSGATETVSLSPAGTIAVINGVSSTIPSAATITAAPEITVDGQVITAAGGSGTTYLVSGKILTPGGSVVFNGPNGVETVSLSPDGSTLVEAVSGAVTTSALPTGFGVAQTAAPIITIGDETFTALPGAMPSYLLPDGQTLHAGGPALTETIDGSVYIVSLKPSATILVIDDVGPGGVVTRTEFETLFPATITRPRGTATVTVSVDGSGLAAGVSTQTEGAGASSTGRDPASLQGTAFSNKKIGGSLAVGAVGIALFAVLL